MLSKNKFNAFVEFETCTGCGNCVITCPYDAVELKEQDRMLKAVVLAGRCTGCGSCVASCWNAAIQLHGSTDKEILDLIRSYSIKYSKDLSGNQDPKVLVFVCENCFKPGNNKFELNDEQNDSPILSLGVRCTARLKPEFALKAFSLNFDGVVVFSCGEESCKFQKGNERTVKRFAIFNRIMSHSGFEQERIKVIELSKDRENNITEMIGEYQKQLKLLGPNKLNFEPAQSSIGKKTKELEGGTVDNA